MALRLFPSAWWRRALAGGLLLALWPGACFVARSATYPAPDVPVGAPPAGMEEVRVPRPGGAMVLGWLWPAKSSPGAGGPPAPALLFLHGNGENLTLLHRSGLLHQLHALGAHVLAVDYPGYGRSQGCPSEAALVEAANLSLAWLAARFPGASRVVVGFSLGAAVAAQVAAVAGDALGGVVLIAPWSTLLDAADEHYPRWLARLVLSDRYDTVAAARQTRAPLIIIHGSHDRVIPAWQSERVAAAAPNLRSRLVLPGAGHNDLFDRDGTWAALRAVFGRAW